MNILTIISIPFIALTVMASPPIPFPVFLKAGFSTVLEFEETPSKVVIGDSRSFQVEKLERSIVIKTKVEEAYSNLFVYFNSKEPRLFVLTASLESEPTYYKKFDSEKQFLPMVKPKLQIPNKRGITLVSATYTSKKDFLTVEVKISADSKEKIQPNWEKTKLTFNNTSIRPSKLWSERPEIQRNSYARARFIFHKPDMPANRANTRLEISLKNSKQPLLLSLAGRLK